MSRHHPDLQPCLKQPGTAIGYLCEKCEDLCPTCESHVRPTTLVHICNGCAFGNSAGKCILCGTTPEAGHKAPAYYCYECTVLGRDREGCPKIINLGSSRSDLWYEKKKARQQQQNF
ncbi:hypothetical protein DV451_003042 [Geotrichum candidum]|uniref:Similar to Saccharomyces cerevisiae YPR094W RDS3 Component of the SF3b subcomplex of the U2 snRNP n=1 Tax=Geotrichum candidum TaxID=1173061 RepID=A0A0J9X524_GEOCN|nr:hypothetical protein DV451_003042 [Geotrichum candidum]KAI9212666.1 hypothetical protein DS838_002467 [Geotrichum bryndzae]KAF5108585.1 hypothetical protein DV453_002178 [Geotrichum candidum]KAF5117410.1 hypothetical protein DV454_001079 [Geotrichum candidum]KAF5117744.1 hypothetical protein DV452_002242 [Geotrichum candidum]